MENINPNHAVRIVKTRDSATAILRKMDIKPRDYDFYIEQPEPKKFIVHVEKAELYMASLKQAKTKLDASKAKIATAQIEAVTEIKKELAQLKLAGTEEIIKLGDPNAKLIEGLKASMPRVTCASVAKELILAGKTNKEVWEVISKQFKLDSTKKHYPTWYRCQLKRQKKL